MWPKFGVICRLNHENPSRIAEVRRTLVPTKSILDHTKLQSRFAKEMPENSIISGLKYVLLPQYLMDFHDFNFILLQILVRIFCYFNHENPSRIAEVRRTLVPTKSILDHTKLQVGLQSRCQRMRSFLDQNTSNFRNS